MKWYPLKMTFPVRSYAFGERLIPEMLGKQGTPPGRVSETWEISDYRDAQATITNGALQGQPFHAVVMSHPEQIVGNGWNGPHYPLLAKFLDASNRLPVHLHADDATAAALYGEPNGKSEAWHILWAAPGASILAGINDAATEMEMTRAFKSQDYDLVMPRHPVSAGDTVYVPGGILHSFGPDTLIFEIQQTSDLTKHVMPADLNGVPISEEEWDRNIAQTLVELKRDFLPRPCAGLTIVEGSNSLTSCCAGSHFAMERWRLGEPLSRTTEHIGTMTISNISEDVSIAFGGGSIRLARAESCVIPAALGAFTVEPGKTADLIVNFIPDLIRDIILPLQTAGFSDAMIGTLGEVFVK